MNRTERRVTLDVVIPVYNEEEVLGLLFQQLDATFSPANLEAHFIKSVRYVMVDDGSIDRSAEIISARIAAGAPAVLYRLSRNFGHQNAVSAGLDHADADLVAVIDADLQDPPDVILDMIARWREGYDIVYGQRKKRKENWFKVSCYWTYYRILGYLSEIKTPLDSGDFSLMDRRVVHAMQTLPEKLRFPRGLRSWVGFRHTGVSYERPSRKAGMSKYSFAKLYSLATDGVAASSIRPLKITQFASVVFLTVTSAFILYALIKYLTYSPKNELALWFLFGYILVGLGYLVLSLCLYVLSAYIGRMYLEVKGRPSYVVMEVISRDSLSSPIESGQ